MHDRHQRLSFHCRGVLQLDDARLHARLEGSFEPLTQCLEMQVHFGLHFLWQGRKLCSHECRNAEGDRTSSNTSIPVLDVGMEAFPGMFDLPVELLGAFDSLLAMRPENGCGQASLRREVMMDAWFLDVDRFGDICIAKSRISSFDHQGFRRLENALRRFSLHTKVDYQLVGLDSKYFLRSAP